MLLSARTLTDLSRLPTTMGPRPTTIDPVVLVNRIDRSARSTTGATAPRWCAPISGTMYTRLACLVSAWPVVRAPATRLVAVGSSRAGDRVVARTPAADMVIRLVEPGTAAGMVIA